MIALVPSVSLRMLGLTFYGVGILSYYGPYWALPSALLSPSGLAISIAFINSCSSLGGFLINKSLGFVSTHYGATGIFIVEAILCFAAVAVLALMKIDVKKKKPTNKCCITNLINGEIMKITSIEVFDCELKKRSNDVIL